MVSSLGRSISTHLLLRWHGYTHRGQLDPLPAISPSLGVGCSVHNLWRGLPRPFVSSLKFTCESVIRCQGRRAVEDEKFTAPETHTAAE
jgi:hypothetical protein